MSIVVTINAKRARVDTIQKLLVPVIQAKYPNASIGVQRRDLPESRPDRFAEAVSNVEDASSEAESLRDELQDWLDNMPEGLQGGDKASQLEDAICSLDDFIQYCEDAAGTEVEFPSMMG